MPRGIPFADKGGTRGAPKIVVPKDEPKPAKILECDIVNNQLVLGKTRKMYVKREHAIAFAHWILANL